MNGQMASEAASGKHAESRLNEAKQLKITYTLTEPKGSGGKSRAAMMIKETKKSLNGALHNFFKKTMSHKDHSAKSNPVMTEQTSNSFLSGSSGHFPNLTLKIKKSGKKHSSKSNPELLDFGQNLELRYLANASQQLLKRESCVFVSQSSTNEVICTEDEIKDLRKDYENLMDHLKMAISDSFDTENQKTLTSAITAVVQQEEQDKLWEEAEEEPPCWRPMRCRQMHDKILQEVVKIRLRGVNEEESDTDMLKRDVVQAGGVIQNDLLQVVNHLQRCYSSDFNICNMYARLYHQAYSAKLKKLLQISVTAEDYRFILQQINTYSKDILQNEEMNQHITIESLGALLPEEDLTSLEERYLSNKQKEVKNWLFNTLKLKEADWQADKIPDFTDEYYFCHLALDVIRFVDGAVREVDVILGNNKAQRILLQMGSFLISYKNSVEEFHKSQQINMSEIMKAQLFNISQIREYIEKQENLPDELKATWLSTVSELRDSCHSYFLRSIHQDLKVNYCTLWTAAWFSEHEEIMDNLEETLNEKIHLLKDVYCVCQKELLSQLHFEVMIEYVKRMLKRKLLLQNKDKQEAAAHFLCQDSDRINTLFNKNVTLFRQGSEKEWLSNILPRVSEVIKEQDPDNLELEICALLKQHPDLSEWQVFQLLQLKNRCPDVQMVRECYHQTRNNLRTSESTPDFFCHVPRSTSLSFKSGFCMLPFCCFKIVLSCRK